MRNNWSKLMLVMLLITVFSIQPFSTTAMTTENQPGSSVNSLKTTNTKEQSLQSLNKVVSTNSTSNLRNLSISDLLTYLKASFTYESGYFVDSSYDYLDTTITAAKALNTLKMSGLTGYVIPLDNKTQIYDNFGSIKTNGGFAVKSGVPDASIMGTYGAIESIQLLNLVVQYTQIKSQVTNYLNSKYYLDQGKGGFKESYQTNLSVQSTYYAVEALNSLGFQFNSTQVTAIVSFLQSLWNANGYFSNTNDVDQSTMVTSFQAISVLNILNKFFAINSTFWNQIKSNFPSFVSSNQEQSGVFTGGIHSIGTEANVDDTGSALSSLYILNQLDKINVTNAVQFLIQSQYTSGKFGKDIGGFSPNNSTQSSLTQYSDVTLSHTYYAILGLYASGYLTNYTSFSFQTDYSKVNNVNNNNNEMVVGQNTTLFAQVNTLDYKNAFDSYNIHIQAANLSVAYESTTNNNTATGSIYNFAVTNTSASSYKLGAHLLQAQYSLTNFTALPVRILNYTSDLIVRLPITSLLNTVSTSLTVAPGDTLNGEIQLDTGLINQDGIVYNSFGNVSVSIVYPGNTVYVINGSNRISLSNTSQNYKYTYKIPNTVTLGDYLVKLNYYNGSSTSPLFFTQQVFTVSTNINLLNIQGQNNKLDIYPGSNFNLNFTLGYETGNINKSITSINAKFIETTTHIERFNVSLDYVTDNIFEVNTTEQVPVGLLVGDYNVSITLTWDSLTTGNQLVKSAVNATMPVISYKGIAVIDNQNIAPASSQGNLLYSGNIVNLTANLGMKNVLTSHVYPLNNSYDFSAIIVNTKDFSINYQNLLIKPLNNSEISAYGEINSNINQLNDVNISILLKVKMTSTGVFSFLSTNKNNNTQLYIPSLLLKKAQLYLDTTSVDFIIGAPTVNLNSYTTLLATFKVKDQNSNQYVSDLKLNGTLVLKQNGNQNDTVIKLPSVTSLQENNSYQIQIPLEGLNTGNYNISISTLNTNLPIGSFSLTINPESTNTGIPIENFISLGAIALAVIITLVGIQINKRKK